QTRTWDNSEALFTRVVRCTPDSIAGCLNLGNLRRDAGDLAAALELYRRAESRRQINLHLLRNTWEVLLALDRPLEAYEAFRREMAVLLKLPTELTGVGFANRGAFGALLLARGHVAPAAEELRRVLRAEPHNLFAAQVLQLAEAVLRHNGR
ncbi:MAG: hypothetical protein NZ561_04910, partial [Phycisphaerae bacterium]|nr:hypothetical protein [Phycisphaerae bacterium]